MGKVARLITVALDKARIWLALRIMPGWARIATEEHSKFFGLIYHQLGPKFIHDVLKGEQYGFKEEVIDLGTGQRYRVH